MAERENRGTFAIQWPKTKAPTTATTTAKYMYISDR